jgi:hypothetical protein
LDSGVLEEYAFSIFRVKVIRIRMWPGYVGRVSGNVVIQNFRMGGEEKPCPGQWGVTKSERLLFH